MFRLKRANKNDIIVMTHVYCSSCGCKHVLGAKFCSSCGSSMVAGAEVKRKVSAPTKQSDVDEDGIPLSFTRPQKIEYDIVDRSQNKFSVADVISQAPATNREPRARVLSKKMSKEEYLAQSLKECAQSKNFQDVNE